MTEPKVEEKWGERIENFLQQAKEDCMLHSTMNTEAGYHFKRKKVQWGLPTVLIPVIMSPVSLMIGWSSNDTCDTITAADYVNSLGYLMVGVCSGVYTFFDYSKRVTEHFNVSLMFDTIVSEIDIEMTKARAFRVQADVFLTKITMRIADALRQEPVIPGKILNKYNDNDVSQRVNLWEGLSKKDNNKKEKEKVEVVEVKQ